MIYTLGPVPLMTITTPYDEERRVWSQSANASVLDGLCASSNLNDSSGLPNIPPIASRLLYATGGDFSSLRHNSTIVGITAHVTRKAHDSTGRLDSDQWCRDETVRLLRAGTPISLNAASGDDWTKTLTTIDYRGDTWNEAWSVEDVLHPSFGLEFAAVGYCKRIYWITFDAYVDSLSLSIHYRMRPMYHTLY